MVDSPFLSLRLCECTNLTIGMLGTQTPKGKKVNINDDDTTNINKKAEWFPSSTSIHIHRGVGY